MCKPRGASRAEVVLSVVIGCFNGESKLPAALDALARQQHDTSFEVIVVDDASTDRTAEIAASSGAKTISLNLNQGHGAALNVGLWNARGKYLAMMDDDCVPPPDWIQNLADAWESVTNEVTMIGGIVQPLEVDTFGRRYVQVRRPLRHEDAVLDERVGVIERLRHAIFPPVPSAAVRPVFYTVGANSSVRVEATREVGGFKETPGAGEEESIARKLRARFGDGTVVLFPWIVMMHDFGPSILDSFRRARSYGRANGNDWQLQGGLPRIRPCSAIVVALCLFALPWKRRGVLLALLSVPILYRKWMRPNGARQLERLTYPYCEFVEELFFDVGFLQGWARAWSASRRAQGPGLNAPVAGS